MKDIYENLVIGNFLFGLGAEMARLHLGRGMPETLIANLQQMPMDACYADVLIKNPGVFRVIEFKREARRRRDLKEAAKLKMIEDGMRSAIFSAEEAEQLNLSLARSIGTWKHRKTREWSIQSALRHILLINSFGQILFVFYWPTSCGMSQANAARTAVNTQESIRVGEIGENPRLRIWAKF